MVIEISPDEFVVVEGSLQYWEMSGGAAGFELLEIWFWLLLVLWVSVVVTEGVFSFGIPVEYANAIPEKIAIARVAAAAIRIDDTPLLRAIGFASMDNSVPSQL
jgi:hypothetical protein